MDPLTRRRLKDGRELRPPGPNRAPARAARTPPPIVPETNSDRSRSADLKRMQRLMTLLSPRSPLRWDHIRSRFGHWQTVPRRDLATQMGGRAPLRGAHRAPVGAAGRDPSPASAESASCSAGSRSTPCGDTPRSTVITQSPHAGPRATQLSQSTCKVPIVAPLPFRPSRPARARPPTRARPGAGRPGHRLTGGTDTFCMTRPSRAPSPGAEAYSHGHHVRPPLAPLADRGELRRLPAARPAPGQRLLDVGCGPGTITVDLAEPGSAAGRRASTPTAEAIGRAPGSRGAGQPHVRGR